MESAPARERRWSEKARNAPDWGRRWKTRPLARERPLVANLEDQGQLFQEGGAV